MSLLTHSPRAQSWKGKDRHFSGRDDADADGALVALQLVDDAPYQSYVVPIYLGAGLSKYLVQVDTGSSDLWITSTACTSAICAQVGSHRYDPSQAQPTGQQLQIQYAEGEADGPVVWDTVQVGGYSIDHQALIAATNVQAEPLSNSFHGVLGLSLPANSQIAQQIIPTVSDAPDGATLISNLFSITPLSTAPGARFFSLALERPGSDRVPSILGIGRHPSDIVPDPSRIQYGVVYTPPTHGPLWWQTSVRSISVFVDGVRKPISIPTSTPSAILDSGVPLIITTTAIANGIYGALGINPASDGNYYLPCTTPLNMTIQLDDRREIPLHPLDLSYLPPSDASSQSCIGSIQTYDHLHIPPDHAGADMILGVPFLRNTYTVMAYDEPFPNGTFPPNSANANMLEFIRPRLGLLGLTDPATAANEFHQVRVLKQPLGPPRSNTTAHASSGEKGLSMGIKVLIGLLSFFALCFVLFGARWAYTKRRWARERARPGALEAGGGAGKDGSDPGYAYHLTASKSDSDYTGPSEDELRQRRFDAYKRRHMDSQYTDDTGITFVEDGIGGGKGKADEFGVLKTPDTPRGSFLDATLVDTPAPPPHGHGRPTSYFDSAPNTPVTLNSGGEFFAQLSPPPRTARAGVHARTPSGGPGADAPLLAVHRRSDSNPRASWDIGEFGGPMDMAGVGSLSLRGRRVTGGGSPMSSFGPLPPSPGTHGSRTPSRLSEVQTPGGGAAEGRRRPSGEEESRSLREVPVASLSQPLPAVVSGSNSPEPGLDASMNASRVSLHGHES